MKYIKYLLLLICLSFSGCVAPQTENSEVIVMIAYGTTKNGEDIQVWKNPDGSYFLKYGFDKFELTPTGN